MIRWPWNFYPRPPRGGRPAVGAEQPAVFPISIHALREEGDMADIGYNIVTGIISIHALREEGDVVHVAAPLS